MGDNTEKLIYWILGGLLSFGMILAGAWGKAVLAQLQTISDKLGAITTEQAVHGLRLDNLEKSVASLMSRPRAEKE